MTSIRKSSDTCTTNDCLFRDKAMYRESFTQKVHKTKCNDVTVVAIVSNKVNFVIIVL